MYILIASPNGSFRARSRFAWNIQVKDFLLIYVLFVKFIKRLTLIEEIDVENYSISNYATKYNVETYSTGCPDNKDHRIDID